MIKNQSNKLYLEMMVNSGVSFFSKNQPNNFYLKISNNQSSINLKSPKKLINIKTVDELTEHIKESNSCLLKNTAKKTVISDGNIKSQLMIIGEAPGKEEDDKGKPFVGKAGILLNKMLSAINLERNNVYITNVIPWRPPNNRTPTNDEILQCLPYLQKHIEIIKPDFLLLLGVTAAKATLASTLSISKLRNKWHNYKTINLEKKIKALVSYHPAFLLRSPEYKKEAWEDLKILQKVLNKNEN